MRAGKFLLTVFLLLQSISLVVPTAKAGLIISDDALYIALGATYSNVGWLQVTEPVRGTQFGGSAVLIDPHWALMTAHEAFIVNNNLSSFYERYTVGFGSNYLTSSGEFRTASKVFIEPTYRDVGRGYDLALLYFDTPFATVAPIERYIGEIAVGMDSYLVGYGFVQTAGQPFESLVFTGDRRAGNNVIRSVPASVSRPEFVRTTLRDNFFSDYRDLQMGVRPGDSGGALIIDDKLAGIASIYGGDDFGALSDYSRLNNTWIDATIAAQAVPEPCTTLLLLAWFVAILMTGKTRFLRGELKI